MKNFKICSQCGKTKKVEDFYGVQSDCKECYKNKVKERYYNPVYREKIKEYERKRSKDPRRKELAAIYQANRRKKNPNKVKCRSLVNNFIRDGKIIRQPCEICGEKNAEAHHEDYRSPLKIKWFCFKHHREIHNKK